MYLTPRKSEIEAVAAILSSNEEMTYETPEAMARDIIKVVAQVLSERDSYGVHAYFAVDDGAGCIAHRGGLSIGCFYDRRDAEKCLKDAREAGMEARIARLSGTASIKPPEALQGVVCECGHRKELHPKADRCRVLPTCSCKGFAEPK